MKDKSTILKCFNHSHFVKALALPEIFEFKNPNIRNIDLFYNEVFMECRATLDDLSLIEGKPFMLYGQFVTKEQKRECVLDLMDFIPNSATSISLVGGYDSSVVRENDTIIITSHFTAYKTKLGANRDNISMHDPMITFERIENNTNSFVGGTVEDVFKLSGSRVVHTSSITDDVDIFDVFENELPKFVRGIDEVYPKGLLIRKSKRYSLEELQYLKEQRELKLQKKLHIEEMKKLKLQEELQIKEMKDLNSKKKPHLERKKSISNREDIVNQREKRELKKIRKGTKKNKSNNRSKRG